MADKISINSLLTDSVSSTIEPIATAFDLGARKYKPYPVVGLKDRTWPDRTLTSPPIWCSVDLRDGNQALVEPMDVARKIRLFKTLVEVGFKEIEVGFPSSSQIDYDFIRHIIDNDLIPEDVSIQVLTQARPHLIEQTFACLHGANKVIMHLYNSTSELQRRVVFRLDKAGIKAIATDHASMVLELAQKLPDTKFTYEYSPESFTGTELDFATEVCDAVCDIWQPKENPVIINLPATVEMSSPNIYADQIEWMGRNLRHREDIVLSLHPHNDRGTAVAACEQALMAGADRVEGTLFGNGERTGNLDIVTLALNLYSQGVPPQLDMSNLRELVSIAEECTKLPVHPRHPYAGDLVFTAFSGSHQDAIKKGFRHIKQSNSEHWEVPYLPIDPRDLGRNYEAVIRVNSQSGKGGISWLMEKDHGIGLPRRLQMDFSRIVQIEADKTGKEIIARRLMELFSDTYIHTKAPYCLLSNRLINDANDSATADDSSHLECKLRTPDGELTISGSGNGPIAAFVHALNNHLGFDMKVHDYHQEAVGVGAEAEAAAYVEISLREEKPLWGVGIHANTMIASLMAVVSGLNRAVASE